MASFPSRSNAITGLTRSLPLLAPVVCSRSSVAPSNGPPTLPPLARNSAMMLSFQLSAMAPSYAWATRRCTQITKSREPVDSPLGRGDVDRGGQRLMHGAAFGDVHEPLPLTVVEFADQLDL